MTIALLLGSSLVGVAKQYFGDPINCQVGCIQYAIQHSRECVRMQGKLLTTQDCDFSLVSLYQSSSGVSSKVLDDYCWVHSTFHIRTEYQVLLASSKNCLLSSFCVLIRSNHLPFFSHHGVVQTLNLHRILKPLSSHMTRSYTQYSHQL